jgi:hypothetical protein
MIGSTVLLALSALALIVAPSGAAVAQELALDPEREARLRAIVPKLSTALSIELARRLGMTEMLGKPVPRFPAGPGAEDLEPLATPANVPVADGPGRQEQPSIAVNPVNDMNVLVAFHNFGAGVTCAYAISTDGGATFGPAIDLPLDRPATDFCFNPQATRSPDGTYFYIAYVSVDFSGVDSAIKLFRLNGDFSGTSGPFTVVPRDGSTLYDAPALGTHRHNLARKKSLYLTFTEFLEAGDCNVGFTRSTNFGKNWSTPQQLAASGGTCGDVVLQGSDVAGGPGMCVLTTWFNSGTDGWGAATGGGGKFQIETRHSDDGGLTWGPVLKAVTDKSETPFDLGPSGAYHRLWFTMTPKLDVAPDGSGHIVYTRDPAAGSLDGEDGDVRYISSPRPYTVWTSPLNLAKKGGTAQYFANITTQKPEGGGCELYVPYLTGQRSPAASPNLNYDLYYRLSGDCGLSWDPPVRLSSVKSLSHVDFAGDLTAVTSVPDEANCTKAGFCAGAAWTDRRAATATTDFNNDVFVVEGGE